MGTFEMRCVVFGHRWVRVADTEGIVRCRKCGKEKEAPGRAGLVTGS